MYEAPSVHWEVTPSVAWEGARANLRPALDGSSSFGLTLLRIWALVAAMALAVHLGGYPLFDADEGRNGEVGREMAATNDYVMPRYDGMPYLDKPIVYFAAEAAAMEVLGATETAARLPAYLFTLATAALLFWFAKRVWGPEGGWTAVIAYLAMPLTLAFARTVIFDSALSFFVVAAIIAFYLAVEARAAGERWLRWPVLAWAAIAVGVLVKGPVAIALPLFVAIPYALTRRAFRALWSWWGLVVFIAIIAPWVWAVSQVVPDFLHYVVVTETAQRMATKALKRTGPPWYFVPYLIGGAMPWSIAALFALRRESAEGAPAANAPRPRLYVLLWILVPFVFFSISQSKRPQYILPLMPAVALLIAQFWPSVRRVLAVRVAAIVILLFGMALLAAPAVVHHARKMKPEVAEMVDDAAIPLGACCAAGAIAALAFARRRELALVALSIPVLAMPMAANPLMNAIGGQRSARAFAAQLAPHLRPETAVIGIEAFTGSLAFYLQRQVLIVTPDAEETTSNYLIRHYSAIVDRPTTPVRSPQWLQRTLAECCPSRVYIVRNNDRANQALLAAHGLHPLATGVHFIAYGR